VAHFREFPRWGASAPGTRSLSTVSLWAPGAPSGAAKMKSALGKRPLRTSAANRGAGCRKWIVLPRGITKKQISIIRTTRVERRVRTTFVVTRRCI
jgi:hypothetical protein